MIDMTEQQMVSAEFVERDETGFRLRTQDMVAEIIRLRAALREIEALPRADFIMQGPRLAASIARRALAAQP